MSAAIQEAPAMVTRDGRLYAGREWLVTNLAYTKHKGVPALPASALGLDVADVLGMAFAGIYHVPDVMHKRTEWHNESVIRVHLAHELATWDGSELTALVVGCLDRKIRFAVRAKTFHVLELLFTRISFESERFPDVHQHIARFVRTSPGAESR